MPKIKTWGIIWEGGVGKVRTIGTSFAQISSFSNMPFFLSIVEIILIIGPRAPIGENMCKPVTDLLG